MTSREREVRESHPVDAPRSVACGGSVWVFARAILPLVTLPAILPLVTLPASFDAPSRCSRWSPTRSALAIVVSPGLTRYLLAEHRPPRNRRAAAAERTEEILELGQQPPVRFGVVVGLGEVDVPVAVDRDAVVRVGNALGGQPEVDRVPRDVVEREPRPRSA
jgi:hypothetical protein